MSNDSNEQQRFLKQQAHQEKQRAFYLEHGRWPADGEISDTAKTQTEATTTVEQDDPLDYLFEPRD
jgi:hypothetical protein